MKKALAFTNIKEHDHRDDLPEGWVEVLLPEVCTLNPRKPLTDALAPDATVTFVPMPAVDEYLGAITKPQTRPFAEVRKGYTAFQEEDVIMAKITPCMENGKSAVAHNLENNLGFGSTEFHVLRSNGTALPDYMYYYIRQESFRRDAASEMTGSVGQKRVPVSFLEKTVLPLPPLAEQKRIIDAVGEILNRLSLTQGRLARVPNIIKAFRQSVLAAACSGRLTEDWREKCPETESTLALIERIKDFRRHHTKKPGERSAEVVRVDMDSDEFSDVPDTWIWVQFGSVIGELRNGISTKPDQEPPGTRILRISSVRSGAVLWDDMRYLPDSDGLIETYRLRDGDLLFTRYNGSLDLLGVCGMVRNPGEAAVLYPDKLMRVRIDHPYMLPEYAEIFFQAPASRERMTAKSKSSAGQQGISGADVKSQPIALPPFDEQHEIVRRVNALFQLADKIEERIATATERADKLTQTILAKAFRGELVPTEAELALKEGRDYEPASVLLEKTKSEREKAAASRSGARKPVHT